ncbi:Hypothetical predicted protein, partial [Paramuricea clavata]
TKRQIWCDVHTDGGGFALVGMMDSPVSWTVPSNSTPVDPQGPPHWLSDLGDVKVLDFRVQFSTDKSFEGTKADWFYRLNPQRKFGNLLSVNNGCPHLQAGIGNISFVKDISTHSVLTNNFKCSKFGPHIHHMLGWGKMNYCLRHQCNNGYAILVDEVRFRYDNFGSYSYSAASSFSGMKHNSTAFVGCDHGKCCACFGPKGGRQNYCGPKCTAINGGTVIKSAFVWFWVRTRMPESLWKRCMEFVMKNSAGKLETHFIDPQTGTAHKGSCSGKHKSVLNEGTLTVSDKESFDKIPDVPGLLSYRKDDKQLYVNQGSEWQALSTEQEECLLIIKLYSLNLPPQLKPFNLINVWSTSTDEPTFDGLRKRLIDINICSLVTNNGTESSVDDDWSTWKDAVMSAVHEFIPSKYVDPRRSLPWITPTILHQIRKKVTARKRFLSRGTDYLKAKFNKLRAESLRLSQVPNEWKLANIIPLLKKGSKDHVENYRPISLLCILWFQNYLSGRFQPVTVHGATSTSLPITSGVPQGSLLGPFLFSVYINDLPNNISTSTGVGLFADDTKLYRCVQNPCDALVLQDDIQGLLCWSIENRLRFNQSKCKVLSITRKKWPLIYPYELDNDQLLVSDAQVDLGVTISCKLLWNHQVNKVRSKANQMLGLIRQSTAEMTVINARRLLYIQLVRSNFGYASQVWCPQSIKLIEDIDKQLKKQIQSQEAKIQNQEKKIESQEKKIQDHENMTRKLEKQNQDIVKRIDKLHSPASCSALLIKHPSTPSGMYYINPEALGSSTLVQVYCNMTSKNGVGITVIGHDSESRTLVNGYESVGSYQQKIKYNISMEQIVALVKQSKNCEQFIKYECYHSGLWFSAQCGWWVSRQGSKMNYWGGAAVNSGKCACGMTNSCAKSGGKCNCDKNDYTWREDSGYLTDKNTLPVTELRFGDTGDYSEKGYHTLGKLRCWG